MTTPEQWLSKLARLRVDRQKKKSPAPHKPLLLLVLLDLAQQGQLPPDVVPLTSELAFKFASYWSIVAHRRTQPPDVRLPFHHLQTGGFWEALNAEGKPSPDDRLTHAIRLTPDFTACLADPAFRDKARRILIANYFEHHERLALYSLLEMPAGDLDEMARDAQRLAPEEAKKQGREVRFRLNVVAAYKYTCALTGYRLTTISTGSIVDAAHIHQFSASRNNDPQNGLALCKNAHWLFDNGLWSLTDEYTVLVAVGHFDEECFAQTSPLLASFQGKRIHLPADQALWPHPKHLDWHRRNKFRGVAGA
jgi:putative restriction endonuclease